MRFRPAMPFGVQGRLLGDGWALVAEAFDPDVLAALRGLDA